MGTGGGRQIWARLPTVVGAGGVLEIRNWWLARGAARLRQPRLWRASPPCSHALVVAASAGAAQPSLAAARLARRAAARRLMRQGAAP